MPTVGIAYNATMLAQKNEGLVATILGGVSAWSVVLTLFLGLVLYDQGERVWLLLLATILLTRPSVMYIYRKGSIVGPSWKAPFIGPFLDSMNPKFEKYHAKWMSGPLSCVSVFHK